MAVQDITEPMALDSTLQDTNTALGLLAKDATVSAISTALGLLGKDTSIQAVVTALGLLNKDATMVTQNSKLDTIIAKLQGIIEALGVDTSIYKAAGNKACAELTSSLLVAGNLGNVYNITDNGTTTADFVEGAGKPIHLGDNVAVVDIGTGGSHVYKFDLLSGLVDLSNYIQKSETAGLVKNDGTIDTNDYAEKVAGATNGNLAGLNASGNLTDSGWNGAKDTTSISGNPLSITGLKSNQLAVNPIITLEPIQDLHGQSKPYPAGGGKNILPTTVDNIKSWNTAGTWTGNAYVYNGVTYTILTDDANNVIGIKVNGTASANSGLRISGNASTFLTDGVDYKMKGCPSGSSTSTYYFVLATTFDSGRSVYEYGSGLTFTYTASSLANKQFYIGIWAGYNASNLMYYPMISVSTGSTYPDFEPYTNICPISGYDKIEVLSCGKNIACERLTSMTINGSGVIAAFNGYDLILAPVKANTTYVISGISDSHKLYAFYTTKPTTGSTSYDNARTVVEGATTGYSFTTPISGWVAFRTGNSAVNVQCEEGSSATSYVPYNKTTDLSEPLGQTVYGGTLDVRTGVFTVTHAKKRLEGNDTWTGSNKGVNAQLAMPDMKSGDWFNDELTVCDTLEKVSATISGKTTIKIGASNTTVYLYNMALLEPTIESQTALNNYLTDHPIEFTYPLATPIEIQLTPHEISLLKDYAYVNTNGTNIALDYHNGELASLSDVAQLSETVERLTEYIKGLINNA